MRIVVIVESLLIEKSSGAKANSALIQNLKRAGHDLIVFHYSREEVFLEGIKCILIKEERRSFLFFLSRIERYIRIWAKIKINNWIENLNGFSFTLLNDRNSIARFLKTKNNVEPDLVITLSQGASFRPHHALLLIPEWHQKWMAYIHDPYPLHCYPRPYDYVEAGHSQKREFFKNVAKKAKFTAYPSELLADWMESYYSDLKGKRIIIPHQIIIPPVNVNLPTFFEESSFNVVHAGSLLDARNPLFLVRAFERFLTIVPEAKNNSKLIFLGPSSKYSTILEELSNRIPEIYVSSNSLPYEEVTAIQKAASVNIIIEAKGPISPFLPGKFAHCIWAKKPILLLGPHYSETRRLLGIDYNWVAEIDDEDKIVNCLIQLFKKRMDSSIDTGLFDNLKNYMSPVYLKDVISKLENDLSPS